MREEALFDRYMKHLAEKGVTVSVRGDFASSVKFSGDDEFVVWTARNTAVHNRDLFWGLMQSLGIAADVKKDMGDDYIRPYHMRHVYGAVIAPVTEFEENVCDFWRERQAICFADNLPDDFVHVWFSNIERDMADTYWTPYYSIDPSTSRSFALKENRGRNIIMDIRGGWHEYSPVYPDGRPNEYTERDLFVWWKTGYEKYFDPAGFGWDRWHGITPAKSWEVLSADGDTEDRLKVMRRFNSYYDKLHKASDGE